MKNLNIPIYRAKKIDSDEYVEGSIRKLVDEDVYIIDYIKSEKYKFCTARIDITTLKVSFNDKDWYSIEEAKRRINASYLAEAIGMQE